MVVIILDAEVLEDNWQRLQAAYIKETTQIPEGIYQTFLTQSQSQPTKWRIMTHWRSQEDLDKMRQTEETPPAVRVFQAADAKPDLGVWNIKTHKVNKQSDYF